jgi:hypothetical protein
LTSRSQLGILSSGALDERHLLERIDKSGLYLPNNLGRIYLEVLEETLGKAKFDEILKLADLAELIGNYPPRNMVKEFDFACFSALNRAMDSMFGTRASRSLAQNAGRRLFSDGLKHFGALCGTNNPVFKNLPIESKLKVGVPTIARILSKFSDQLCSVQDVGDALLFHSHRCPACWGRSSQNRMLCFSMVGLLKEGLKSISGGYEFQIEETACISRGAECCTFFIRKEPLDKTKAYV